MTIIHMKTEDVQNLVQVMNREISDLSENASRLKRLANRLDASWDGGHSSSFLSNLRNSIGRLENQIDQLERMRTSLSMEIEQWQYVDNEGKARWKNVSGVIPSFGVGIGAIAARGQTFDWFGWWQPLFGIGEKLLTKMPYDSVNQISYQSIGRFLNWLSSSQKAGWVGLMDKLGHLIKTPALLPLIGYGFGALEDLHKGDDWKRAFGSEVIDASLNLIPIVAVYNLLLASANLGAGIGDLLGYHENAAEVQNFIEKLDFGEKFGDAVYDFGTAHPDAFLKAVLIPGFGVDTPEYARFSGTFLANNLRDFGWESGAIWVDNNTEISTHFVEYLDVTNPQRYFQKWFDLAVSMF